MARIVLGIGTSHSPQLSIPVEHWAELPLCEETSRFIPSDLDAQLALGALQKKYDAAQAALQVLTDELIKAEVDAIIMFGDDQDEQFDDTNMPAIALFHGDRFSVGEHIDDPARPWWSWQKDGWRNTRSEFTAASDLAWHLVRSLTDQEFDVARCSEIAAGKTIGHAFSFLHRRLWPDCPVPIVPLMLNTYFPPNQPTPRRCFRLGQAVRAAVEAWDEPLRVAVIASGGLSHRVLDESFDREVLRALQESDTEALFALPRDLLVGGTSETLNWLAVHGAMNGAPMTLVDYIPAYRTKPSTGVGFAFAHWR